MRNGKQNLYQYPIGADIYEENGKKEIRVSYLSESENCGIVFFERKTGKEWKIK